MLEQVSVLFTDSSLRAALSVLFDPWERLRIPGILAFVLAAYLIYRTSIKGKSDEYRDFLSYIFPRKVYRGKSFRVDVWLFLLASIVKPAKWVLYGLTIVAVSVALAEGAERLFGPAPIKFGDHFLSLVLLSVTGFLLRDLCDYVVHRASHEIPLLWSFHRVHHSAPTLNPLTAKRDHPVFDLADRMLKLLILAPFYAALVYFWPTRTSAAVLFGVTVVGGAIAFVGNNLRHSHIWWSWGPVLEHIFISPAQHQVHHGQDRRHWDVNFGVNLAIWDWMFGSLYLIREREQVKFGLSGETSDVHDSFAKAIVEPFHYARALLREGKAWRRDRAAEDLAYVTRPTDEVSSQLPSEEAPDRRLAASTA